MHFVFSEKRKTDALTAANSFTQAVVAHLNTRLCSALMVDNHHPLLPVCCRVSHAYNNQKRLDVEAKKLQNNVSTLVKQTNQWLQLTDNFNQALKEIGDVENWAKTIEADIQDISTALESAYKGII